MTLIYLAALAALFVYAFWSVDSFTGKVVHAWSFDNFREIFESGAVPRRDLADGLDRGRR